MKLLILPLLFSSVGFAQDPLPSELPVEPPAEFIPGPGPSVGDPYGGDQNPNRLGTPLPQEVPMTPVVEKPKAPEPPKVNVLEDQPNPVKADEKIVTSAPVANALVSDKIANLKPEDFSPGDHAVVSLPYPAKASGSAPERWAVITNQKLLLDYTKFKVFNEDKNPTISLALQQVVPNEKEGYIVFRDPTFKKSLRSQLNHLDAVLQTEEENLIKSIETMESCIAKLEPVAKPAPKKSKKK